MVNIVLKRGQWSIPIFHEIMNGHQHKAQDSVEAK